MGKKSKKSQKSKSLKTFRATYEEKDFPLGLQSMKTPLEKFWESKLLGDEEKTQNTGQIQKGPLHDRIQQECDLISKMLQEKNRKYGNSALAPIRVFSTASSVEQILVRIDDKLSRISAAAEGEDEDVILDLIGYLVLLKIAKEIEDADR